MPSVTASAPGKVILLGEHAAVYGRPALVTGAGLRLRATVADAGRGVHLAVPSSGHEETTTWEAVLGTARAARAAWERYAAAPSAEAFRQVAEAGQADGGSSGAGSSAGRLLRIALGEAADSLAAANALPDPADLAPISLTVRSEIPVGSGFGSSAAAAVAVILAYRTARCAAPSSDELHRLSLEVERRQHGTPSGVDNATVIHGGVLEARRAESGAVELRSVAVDPERLRRFRIVGSGPPAEGTGTVVAAVRDLRQRDPAATEALFDRLAGLVSVLRSALGPDREGEDGDERPGTILDTLRQAHRCLVALGVVPKPVQALVEAVEASGGAAKISGAGSLAGPGAGNVLLYHPDPLRLERVLAGRHEPGTDRPLRIYDVELGAAGARLDPAQHRGAEEPA